MSMFKRVRVPMTLVAVLLILCGTVAAVAAVYLLLGLAWALLAGGASAVVAGFLVDVD